MIDEDRLHREIDRETTAEESERLRQELEREPEARAQFEQLVHLVRTLESVPAEEPPVGFVAGVMRMVRAKAPASSALARFSESFRRNFLVRPALGFSLTLASGLLMGAILLPGVAIGIALGPRLGRYLDAARGRLAVLAISTASAFALLFR